MLFISGESKSTAQKSAELLLKIVSQSGSIRGITSIVDRDSLTQEQVVAFKAANPSQKFLSRKEIENFLLDSEIIDKYCDTNGVNRSSVTSRLVDSINDDAKHIQSALKSQCGFGGSTEDFKIKLAEYITSDTNMYKQLKADIEI